MKKNQWPVRTSVSFSKVAYRKIRTMSRLKGVSISDMVRIAVKFYFENTSVVEKTDNNSNDCV